MMLPEWTTHRHSSIYRGRRTDRAQTFEDFGESTDVREGGAAAPRVTHVYQPWIEGLDVLVFVCDETMLNEGTANINSK